MKKLIMNFGLLMAVVQLCFAGGNTSVVELEKVTSIKIEDEKITVMGSGMLMKRVMTDAEHGDSTCFGQPTQMLHAKVTDGVFVVVPYFVSDELLRGPGAAPREVTEEMKEKMKAKSLKWWKETLEHAKKIKVGDKVTIGYQGDKMTLRGAYVTDVIGAGSVMLTKKVD